MPDPRNVPTLTVVLFVDGENEAESRRPCPTGVERPFEATIECRDALRRSVERSSSRALEQSRGRADEDGVAPYYSHSAQARREMG